jgi:hypothetical protein
MVLPDPLFELSRQRSGQARTLDRFLNMRQKEDFDRAALTKAAAFMVRAAPLVAADYIKFFPTSYCFEPPVQLPVRGPEATFRQSLPEEVRRVYEDSAVIRSMERTESGWRVGDTLERGRGISIAFDREGHFYGYHLFEQVVTEVDEAAREFQFRLTLPDTPPDEQQFRVWSSNPLTGPWNEICVRLPPSSQSRRRVTACTSLTRRFLEEFSAPGSSRCVT